MIAESDVRPVKDVSDGIDLNFKYLDQTESLRVD